MWLLFHRLAILCYLLLAAFALLSCNNLDPATAGRLVDGVESERPTESPPTTSFIISRPVFPRFCINVLVPLIGKLQVMSFLFFVCVYLCSPFTLEQLMMMMMVIMRMQLINL